MEEKSINSLLDFRNTANLIFQRSNELLHDQKNQDVLTKLKTLIEAISNFAKTFRCQEKDILLRETSQLLPLLKVPYSLQTNEKLQHWLFVFLEVVDAELVQVLNDYVELTAQTANKLYDYIEQRKKYNHYAILLFQAVSRTGYSLPERTYTVFMEAIQQNPDMFRFMKGRENYVYQQTPQRTFEHCTVCGGEGKPYYTSFAYRMSDFENPFEPVKTWIKCNHCGNLFTHKFPEEFLKQCEHYELMSPNVTPPPRYRTLLSCNA